MKPPIPTGPRPDHDELESEESMLDPPSPTRDDEYDTDLWFDQLAQSDDNVPNQIIRHRQLIEVLNRFH